MNISIRTSQKQMSESYWLASLLTVSGGLQDIYSYQVRGHVFANAQTGNIVFLADSLVRADWKTFLHYLVPLLFFTGGILIAELIRLKFHHRKLHWRQWIVLLEVILLAAVPFIENNMLANALISMSCAMQVQSFRKFHQQPFASTMCIGNMRNMMQNLADYIHYRDSVYLRRAFGYLRILMCFLAGAVLGSFLIGPMQHYTIMVSVILLLAAFLLMFYHAESRELEKAEAEN